MVISGDILKE